MSRLATRTAAVVSALVVTTGAGIAYAAWTSVGTGAGKANASHAQELVLEAAAVTGADPLYPGGTGDVVVMVNNPNPYLVRLASIIANGEATAVEGTGIGRCDTTGVTFDGVTFNKGHVVKADGTKQFTLPKSAHMTNDSDDGCQSATFSIPVKVTGVSTT